MTDTLAEENIELARDLTWNAAMAAHSGGAARMYIVVDGGHLIYGLTRVENWEEAD
jgi:hypothetical protein